MEINFKYDIGDTVYFCLDYQHVRKAKVYEIYATCNKKEKSKAKVTILYNVVFPEDEEDGRTWLPEESLHKTPDGLYLELE